MEAVPGFDENQAGAKFLADVITQRISHSPF
jgi:hypothetical protein